MSGLAEVRSSRLSVTIDPSRGARIVSLRDLDSGREWLVPPGAAPEAEKYGSEFIGRRIHGWDEMLPTIEAGVVSGKTLPDHGEVWAVPWQVRRARHGGGVRLRAQSRVFPLRLTREVWASGDDILLDYVLRNTGEGDCPYLWAAHPQFRLSSHGDIEFAPARGARAAVVSPEPGPPQSWRSILAQRPTRPGTHLKIAVPAPAAEVRIQDQGSALTMAWSGDPITHLFLLWDNGQFSPERVLAVEPATAASGSLAAAVTSGIAPSIAAGERARWQVTLSVVKGMR